MGLRADQTFFFSLNHFAAKAASNFTLYNQNSVHLKSPAEKLDITYPALYHSAVQFLTLCSFRFYGIIKGPVLIYYCFYNSC